ncbi:MAG: hypothetical protein HQL73_08265 [Magnetococcales bacterium]|nr:hypothetical protein [Magnetococcales bacterium]
MNDNQNPNIEDDPAYFGLNRRDPLVIDTMEEAPSGASLGVTPTRVKGPDGKKKFTIC